MEEKIPGGSATFAAMARAAHLILDDEPKILRDTLALKFSGMPDAAALVISFNKFIGNLGLRTGPEFANEFKRSYRAAVVVRQRYTEDQLIKAIERGVSQYVILGAGLDSFAYRSQELESRLRVFEVDLPGSQLWKKNRLKALNIELPHNLTFVPVDFEKQNLLDELRRTGCRLDIPIFFSWLAVTHFLSEDSIFQTLRDLASTPTGSEIVFSYILVDSLLEKGAQQVVAMGKKSPEPWISQFDPVILAKQLKGMGFAEVRDFTLKDAFNIYLSGRSDELSPRSLGLQASVMGAEHLMKAKV